MPTGAQFDAARGFLEAWVPGWTIGQWAALAELLAEREAAP